MKQRGQFETESAAFPFRFQISRNGKYLCGQFAGKKVNRHLQMMVTSAISMLLCCTMFLGTTMAWFTDSVITAGNKIIIGKLEVDLKYMDYSLNPEKNPNPPDVFATKPDDVWAPDKFVVRKLTVVNSGNLPIDYELNLLPSDHTLAKYFDVYIPGPNADPENLPKTPKDNWTFVGNLAELSSVYKGTLGAAINEQPLTEDIIIGLHMVTETGSTTVASELFGRDFTLYINLLAYQKNMDSQAVDAANAAEQEAALAAIAAQETTRATETETETKFSSSYKLTKPSGSTSSSNTSTETDDDNETQTDEDNLAQTGDDNQTQNGDDNQTQNGGDNQTQNGGDNQTQNGDDNQTQNGDDNQTQNGDDNQTQNGDDNQAQAGDDNASQTDSGSESGTDAQNLEDPDSEASTTAETTSENVVPEGETPENE